MADRLTRWEGRDENGPRAVLAKRDGPWPENYQEALRKLAMYEDSEGSETCCGYPLRDLIVFAEACRQAGVEERDLHLFVVSADSAIRFGAEEFDRLCKKAFEDFILKGEEECSHE